MQPTIYVLAFDPGKVNFAWAYSKHSGQKYTVLKYGMLKHPVQNAGIDSIRDFSEEITQLIQSLPEISYIVVERFQTRPRGGKRGGLLEYCNLMIGIVMYISAVANSISTYAVTASTWKSHMKRYYGDNVMENWMWATEKFKNMTEHEADAVGMTAWKLDKLSGNKQFLTMLPRPKR